MDNKLKLQVGIDIKPSIDRIKSDLTTKVKPNVDDHLKLSISLDTKAIEKQLGNIETKINNTTKKVGESQKLKLYDVEKLEKDGNIFLKQVNDIVNRVKKQFSSMGTVDVQTFSNIKGQIEKLTDTVKTAEGVIKTFHFEQSKMSQNDKKMEDFVQNENNNAIDKTTDSSLETTKATIEKFKSASDKIITAINSDIPKKLKQYGEALIFLKKSSIDNAEGFNNLGKAIAGLNQKEQVAILLKSKLNEEQIKQVLSTLSLESAEKNALLAQIESAKAKSTNKIATKLLTEAEIAEKLVNIGSSDATAKNTAAEIANIRSKALKSNTSKALVLAEIEELLVTKGLTTEQAVNTAAAISNTSAQKVLLTSIKATTIGLLAQAKAWLLTPAGMITAVTTIATFAIPIIINFSKRQQEAIDKASELKNRYDSQVKSINDNISSVKDMHAAFERLSKGVSDNGEVMSLSAEETKRYHEICNKLAELNPQLVTGYDNERNAIINKNNAIDDTIAKLERELELEDAKILSEKDSYYKGFKGEYDKAAKSKKESEYNLEYTNSNIEYLQNEKKDFEKVIRSLESQGFDTSSQRSALSLYEDRYNVLLAKRNQYMSEIPMYEQQMQDASSKYFNMVGASTLRQNGLFKEMDANTQNLVQSIGSTFDILDVDEYTSKLYKLVNTVSGLSDDQKIAIDNLFTIDVNQGINSLMNEVDRLLNILPAEIRDQAKEAIEIKYGINFNQDHIDTMLAGVKGKLEDDFKDKVGTLSHSDLQIAYKIDNKGQLSWDDLLLKIELAKIEFSEASMSASEFSNSMKGLSNSFSTLQTALQEMDKNNGLSTSTVTSIIDELTGAGENYLEYLYAENGQIKLNTEAYERYATSKMQSSLSDANDSKISLEKQVKSLEAERAEILDSLSKAEEFAKVLSHSNKNDSFVLQKQIVQKSNTESIAEYKKSLADIDEQLESTQNELSGVTNQIELTEAALNSVSGTQNFSESISSLENVHTLLSDVKKEMDENNGTIFIGTLNKIVQTYPQMESAVLNYNAGLIESTDVYAELEKCYKQDTEKFIQANNDKLFHDTTFYQNILDKNKDLTTLMASLYGEDYKNWSSLNDAKLGSAELLKSKLTLLWGDYTKYATANEDGTFTIKSREQITTEAYQNHTLPEASKALGNGKYEEAKTAIETFNILKERLNDLLNADYSNITFGSSSNSSSTKDFSQSIDWISNSITNLTRAVNDAQEVFNNTSGYDAQIQAANELYNAQLKLSEGYNSAKQEYKEKYTSSLSKISDKKLMDEVKAKIEGGAAFDIEKFVDKNVPSGEKGSREKLYEIIQSSIGYYEQYKDADANAKQHAAQAVATNKIKFEKNIEKEDYKLDLNANAKEKLQNKIELDKANGKSTSSITYKKLINLSKKDEESYLAKANVIKDQMSSTPVNSDEYRKLANDLQDCLNSLEQCKLEQIDWNEIIKAQAIDKLNHNITSKKNDMQDILNEISISEAKGGDATEKQYRALIRLSNLEELNWKRKRDKLTQELKGLDKNTDKYKEIEAELQECDNAISACNQSQIEWNLSILNLPIKQLEKWNKTQQELNDLRTLLGENTHDEAGNITDVGLANLGIIASQLSIAEGNVAGYSQNIQDLKDKLAKKEITPEEYEIAFQNAQDGQRESILQVKAYRDAIIDFTVKGLEAETEAFREQINVQKEVLRAQKEAENYAKGLEEKKKKLIILEKQIAALSLSSDRADMAEKIKLEKERADLQKEIDETVADHAYDIKIEALDKELESFEKEKEDEINNLKTNLKAQEKLISDSLKTVQTEHNTIYNQIKSISKQYGLEISDNIISPWEQAIGTLEKFKKAASDITVPSADDSQSGSNNSPKTPADSSGGSLSSLSSALTYTGDKSGSADTQLNQYLISQGYQKLSWDAMAKLGQDLGFKDATAELVKSQGSLRMDILAALKAHEISTVLKYTGNTSAAAETELNQFIVSKGYQKLSWDAMAKLGQDLGIKDATAASVAADASIRKQILNSLKNAGFSQGGRIEIGDVIRSNGDNVLMTAKVGEEIITSDKLNLFHSIYEKYKDFKINDDFYNRLMESSLLVTPGAKTMEKMRGKYAELGQMSTPASSQLRQPVSVHIDKIMEVQGNIDKPLYEKLNNDKGDLRKSAKIIYDEIDHQSKMAGGIRGRLI